MPAMHEVSLGGRRAAEMRGYLLLAAANPRRGQPDWLIGDAAVLRVIGYRLIRAKLSYQLWVDCRRRGYGLPRRTTTFTKVTASHGGWRSAVGGERTREFQSREPGGAPFSDGNRSASWEARAAR